MKLIKKKKKINKIDEQEIQKRKLKNRIKSIFSNAGFFFIKSGKTQFCLNNRDIEIDSIYIYENVLILCEDTIKTSGIMDHIRTKEEAYKIIKTNFKDFLIWLSNAFPDYKSIIKKYDSSKYKLFYLYFSDSELFLTAEQRERYSLKFVEPTTLNYFYKITKCTKLSSRYEIFKYLGLKKSEIGSSTNESSPKNLSTTIIYPSSSTGLKNGIRVVSFMISAESLLSVSYVMRKDNWENSIWLYQRLIDGDKIKKIRKFIAEKGQTFYNNIIVSLPSNILFKNPDGKPIDIKDITEFGSCTLEIPDEMNSVCIIDGQHRIFAHYEGDATDKYEEKIAPLRKELHLLVTGLIFPDDMEENEKIKIQSEIFLDINSNAKPVQPDVLLHIAMLKTPLSDIGIARQVIERLNKKSSFLNMFEFSTLDSGKIKIASIIKFALRYLVTITPADGKISLYQYWTGNKKELENGSQKELEEYIEFCASNLEIYFKGLKYNYKDQWTKNNKLLSVTSINGFIIAYNKQLRQNGIKKYEFYERCFKKLNVDFSNERFKYSSSQYRKFSNEILKKAFGIDSKDE